MKKLKLNGKLNLKKETISELSSEQMTNVKGGLLSISKHCTHADKNCKGSAHTDGMFCNPH